MTYQLIDNFAAGLDTRKSPLTSAPGTLQRLVNAAITPGGEIAKRRAFVKVADVPGSFGLAATQSSIYVFGRNVLPTVPALGVPGVTLVSQLIPNPDSTLRQTDFDVYAGKIYLACATGSGLPTNPTEAQNPHYYDTNLTEGAGKGYYVRTYQTKMYSVRGQTLYMSALNNPAVWDEETYIDRVVVTKLDKTNPARCTVSSAEIGQFVNGNAVYIQGATVTGLTNANGFRTIGNVGAVANTFTLTGVNGSTAAAAQTDSKVFATPAIRILGISNTDPARCTVAPADIGKFSEGQKIFIQLVTGSMLSGNFVVTDITPVDNTFALLNIHAAGYPAPQTADTWATLTSDVLREGRGYVTLSTIDADSELLTSLEVYYDKLAIFSSKAVQIWAIDPDPLQNSFDQLLRGAGTTAPRSPLMYGSGDVLYLDPSGIRSLKAKDSSNSAAVSDIGSPVDPTIQAYRESHLVSDPKYMEKATSLLEPYIGRFWMVFPTRILVLSYFPGPKITAWSEYTLPELGAATVEHAVVSGGRVFLRDSLNQIWVYGGPDGTSYNNPGVEVRLPYLDGKKPGHKKMFEALDATVSGTWEARISFNFNNPEQEEVLGILTEPTWNIGRLEVQGNDSHFSLRFWNNDSMPATISNVAVHYNVADDEA